MMFVLCSLYSLNVAPSVLFYPYAPTSRRKDIGQGAQGLKSVLGFFE